MGFPASSMEGIYRNNVKDVYGYFEKFHHDHYKFYNLCSERDYPKERFHGRVAKYPFDDHNPPPLRMFLPFCRDLEDWLNAHPDNVAAIHCKAGKGRTGVMVCAFLLYIGDWTDPDEAMQFYGFARTNNQKGVTIPSQRRFIRYFASLVKNNPNAPFPSIGDFRMNSQDTNEEEEDDMEREGNNNRGSTIKPRGSISMMERPDDLLREMQLVRPTLVSGEEFDTDSEDEGDEDSSTIYDRNSLRVGLRKLASSKNLKERKKKIEDKIRSNSMPDELGEELNLGVDQEEVEEPDSAISAISEISTNESIEESEENKDHIGELPDNFTKQLGLAKKYTRRATKLGRSRGYTIDSLLMSTDTASFLDLTDDILMEEESRISMWEMSTSWVKGAAPPPVPLLLTEIKLYGVPRVGPMSGFDPFFKVKCNGVDICSNDFLPPHNYSRSSGTTIISLPIPSLPVVDEVLIVLYHRGSLKNEKVLGFWLHTAFVNDNMEVLYKEDLDKAVQDKKHNRFDENFRVSIHFTPMTAADMAEEEKMESKIKVQTERFMRRDSKDLDYSSSSDSQTINNNNSSQSPEENGGENNNIRPKSFSLKGLQQQQPPPQQQDEEVVLTEMDEF